MAMNIPATVRGCLDKFKALREPEDYEAAEADTYSIKNESDHFKIWVGNLAAHRPMGKRSLEYRLRDSNDLRSKVLELLNDLSKALDCYSDSLASRGSENSASDSDDELLDFEYDDLATQPPNALQDIHDTINLLYQFSTTLRNPAGHNRIKAGVTSMRPYYSQIYVNHVRDKFPDAAQYLVERLGGAISSRRQYFKYREEHTSKMNAGLEDLDDGQTTTIASSLPKAVEYVTDIEETETNYSMTSYAPTESETSKLRPPPLPRAGCDGDPFECPLCYSMVQVSGETMWKQHVFEDLAPYVCTREDCRLGNKLYTRRRDWQRHQTHMHDRIWVCPLGCGAEYHSSDDFNSHLAKKHGHTNQGGRSTRMACASFRQTEAPFDLRCPLCRKVTASINLWFRHVGKHLEQLALQAVDSHKLATESDDEHISEQGSHRTSDEDQASHGSSSRIVRVELSAINEEAASQANEVDLSAEEEQPHAAAEDPESPAVGSSERPPDIADAEDHLEAQNKPRNVDTSSPPDLGGKPEAMAGLRDQYSEFKRDIEAQEPALYGGQEPQDASNYLQSNDGAPPGYVRKGKYYVPIEQTPAVNSDETSEFDLRKQPEAETVFQAEMRERLQALGYTDQTIDIMVDEEKAKNFKATVEGQSSRAGLHQAPRAPVYPKVHRDYLAIETLKYYDLPWQYDSSDPDYIIIMRDMEKRETDLLFEHTSRLRSGKLLTEPEKRSVKPMAMYRRRSRSRSGRPVEDEALRKE